MAKKKVAPKKIVEDSKPIGSDGFVISNQEGEGEQNKNMNDSEPKTENKYDDAPTVFDPGWTQYVLDQLEPDEAYNNNPKADGLRRLVEKLIGPIINIESHVYECPRYGGDNIDKNTATVISKMNIHSRELKQVIQVSAVADANILSCQPPFHKYLSSIAETRAEARVYRKALRLKNVVTSEEMGSDDKIPQGLADHTVTLINKKCADLDVDVQKVFSVGLKDVDLKKSISLYTGDEAKVVLEKLHKLQETIEKKPSSQKPADLGNYDPSWRDYFG